MKALLIALLLWGCNDKVVIENAGDVEGRKTYHVNVGDKTYEYMYAEEIAHALTTGDWVYNEDLTINKKTK
jgi:hypothetical protein